MTDEKEKIEQTKVLFPKTKAGNKMLKAIIKRAKQQGKAEAIKEEIEFLEILNVDQTCDICKELTKERINKLKSKIEELAK